MHDTYQESKAFVIARRIEDQVRATTEALDRRYEPHDWWLPWSALLQARINIDLTMVSDLPDPLPANVADAQREASRRLAELVADQRRINPATPEKLSAMTIPGPVRRRLLGIPEAERRRPLDEVPDHRPGRWVLLDEQNLNGNINRHGIGYWLAMTATPEVTEPSPWGRLSVVRTTVLVADALVAQHTSHAVAVAVTRKGDSPEMLHTALRLWTQHRHQTGPLSQWATAIQAARGVTG